MKVLMLGWEFPPFFAGGVGIACYELTKSMSKYKDVEVSYVMPYGPEEKWLRENFRILSANSKKLQYLKDLVGVKIKQVSSMLYAYDSPQEYSKRLSELNFGRESLYFGGPERSIKDLYGSNLIEEVYLYAFRVLNLCKDDDFDVIHAHDWTTFPAAVLLKEITGKPLVIHVHITELDKTGGLGGHEEVFKIERIGFKGADSIIAVSDFTKRRLIENYGVDSSKIEVVHNGGVSDLVPDFGESIKKGDKVVLYAGRVTTQKGPEFFVNAARKILEYEPDTKFILAGNGDLLDRVYHLVHEYGMSDNFFILGRQYTRDEAERYFSMASVFVMPSVSEPFGIVPLEAAAKGTPTVISKQSGISEVLDNSFKIDFWDVDEMAHKIICLLRYPNLNKHMVNSAKEEFGKFSWDGPVEKIVGIYNKLLNR